MEHYTLEQAIEHLIKKNGHFQNISIKAIKEDNNFYVIYFKFKIVPKGEDSCFKLNKITGELSSIYLPDKDNFEFLDYFDNCKQVDIPLKFKDIWF